MAQHDNWLREGMRVVTADGVELGDVKEIGATSFKVDAPMSPDYWLPMDVAVLREIGGEVCTTFVRADLDDHIVAAPDEVRVI